MSKYRFTSSANAGLSIEYGDKKIIVDALHNTPSPGFSTLSPTMVDVLFAHPAFQSPNIVTYTHCHVDHFSAALTEKYMEKWPDAKLFVPEVIFNGQTTVSEEDITYRVDGLSLRFIKTPHEGPQFANEIHYCILISDGSFNTLVTGDCAIAIPMLLEKLSGTRIDLAVLDFPWFTLRKGREFMLNELKPEHVILNHIPLEGDDLNGYRDAASKTDRYPELPDTRVMMEAFQTESF